MKSVARLVEGYLDDRVTLNRNSLPVAPKFTDTPLKPSHRWNRSEDKKMISKQFDFRNHSLRDRFIAELLENENETQHRAKLTIDDLCVELVLSTKGVETVTELDKEYANFADQVYRDVCYGR